VSDPNGGNIGISLQGGTGHKIVNNISVIDNHMTRSAISTDIVTTNPAVLFVKDNIIYGNTGPIQENPNIVAIQINTRMVNPQFVSPSNNDFTLMNTSPAINNADEMYLPAIDNLDYFGNPRNDLDIGAVEYQNPLSANAFEKSSHDLIISPNPINGIVNFVNNGKSETIEIYNVFGQLIISFNLENGVNKLDLSNLSEGVYFVKNKKYTMKIIKNSN
jgi:hypothetical protein